MTQPELAAQQEIPDTLRWRDRLASPTARCMLSLALLLIISPVYWGLGAILQAYVGDAPPGDPTLSWALAAMFFYGMGRENFI